MVTLTRTLYHWVNRSCWRVCAPSAPPPVTLVSPSSHALPADAARSEPHPHFSWPLCGLPIASSGFVVSVLRRRGNPVARSLFLDWIKGFLAAGSAEGIFADKWGYKCSQVNATTWKICNNRCGFVTPQQAASYNAGGMLVREQVSALFHVNDSTPEGFAGLLYADGLSNGAKCPKATYPDGSVMINLVGGWATWRPEYTTYKPCENIPRPSLLWHPHPRRRNPPPTPSPI